MSTRCKPGDIAVFISGLNLGKLVHIDRAFAGEETIDGTHYVKTGSGSFAWVVTSLGGPLVSRFVSRAIDPKPRMVSVFNANCLRPLRNPRGTDQTLRWMATPTKKTPTKARESSLIGRA